MTGIFGSRAIAIAITIAMTIALALVAVPPASFADSFRCGNALAREGMSATELEKKCGRPDLVRKSTEPMIVRRPDGTLTREGIVTIYYWYYERGRNQFVARVTIRDSVVRKIELLDERRIESLDPE